MLSAWLGALLLLWVAPRIWGVLPAVEGQPVGSHVCKYECAKFTTKIPLNKLQSYERTNCGKSGIILTTKMNRTFCANPDDQWVQDVMRKLNPNNAPPSSTVDPSGLEQHGHFDTLLGSAVPMSSQTRHPTKTLSTAAYGISTSSVTRAGDLGPSAINSTLLGPQTGTPSARSTSRPEVVVSKTAIRPEPSANRSTPYSADGPKSLEEGLAPAGKGLEDTSGSTRDLVGLPASLGTKATEAVDDEDHKASPTQSALHPSSTIINLLKKTFTSNDRLLPSSDPQGSAIKQVAENPNVGLSTVPQRVDFSRVDGAQASTDGSKSSSVKDKSDIVSAHGEATEANRRAFSKSSSTLSQSVLREEHFMGKSRGEATTSSPEVPLTFLPGAVARYQIHIIAMVFLGFAFCVYLAVTGLCAKNHHFIRPVQRNVATATRPTSPFLLHG
ncbi:fractalkine isoform X2 [Sphaerodactylus townsendi]|uniref:fractalkine isoform X2 n=1 Tax=Sphaerodactylus townsendi TaxID=933632 RepID=UPI002026C291|nr:fractalkine isoform X2 [Sphaerodactylus townsendi]